MDNQLSSTIQKYIYKLIIFIDILIVLNAVSLFDFEFSLKGKC